MRPLVATACLCVIGVTAALAIQFGMDIVQDRRDREAAEQAADCERIHRKLHLHESGIERLGDGMLKVYRQGLKRC